ncbi:unnamed protein product, partial [Brenthis ino]
MKAETLLFLLFAGILLVQCEHLIVGDANNKHLIYHTTAQYHYYPFMKRVKDVFFSSPDLRPINAIMAYDNLHTKASATITAGGLGSTYVNIRLKSERGEPLDYDISIYS